MGRSPPNIAAVPSIECGSYNTGAWVDVPHTSYSGVNPGGDGAQDSSGVAMETQTLGQEGENICCIDGTEASGSASVIRGKPQPYPRHRNIDFVNANTTTGQDMPVVGFNTQRPSGGAPKSAPSVPARTKPRPKPHPRIHRTRAVPLPRRSGQASSSGLHTVPKGLPPRENMSSFDSIEAFAGSHENLTASKNSPGVGPEGEAAAQATEVAMDTSGNRQSDAGGTGGDQSVDSSLQEESGAANDTTDPDSEVNMPTDEPSLGNSSATDNQSETSLQIEEMEDVDMDETPIRAHKTGSQDSQSDGVPPDNHLGSETEAPIEGSTEWSPAMETVRVTVTTATAGSSGSVTTIAAQLARLKTIESAVSAQTSLDASVPTSWDAEVVSSGANPDTSSLTSGSSGDSLADGGTSGQALTNGVSPSPTQAIGAQIVVTAQQIGHEVSRPILRGVAHSHATGPVAMAVAKPVGQPAAGVATTASHESGINPQVGALQPVSRVASASGPQNQYGATPNAQHVQNAVPHFVAQNVAVAQRPSEAPQGHRSVSRTSSQDSTDGVFSPQGSGGSPSFLSRAPALGVAGMPLSYATTSDTTSTTNGHVSTRSSSPSSLSASRRRLLSEEEREQNRAVIQQQLVQWRQSRASGAPVPPPRGDSTRSADHSTPPPPPPRDGSSLSSSQDSSSHSQTIQRDPSQQNGENTQGQTRQGVHQELQRWRQQQSVPQPSVPQQVQSQQHLQMLQTLVNQQQQQGQQLQQQAQQLQQQVPVQPGEAGIMEYRDVIWERRSGSEPVLHQRVLRAQLESLPQQQQPAGPNPLQSQGKLNPCLVFHMTKDAPAMIITNSLLSLWLLLFKGAPVNFISLWPHM